MFSPNATENRVKKGKGKKTNAEVNENRKTRAEKGGKRGSMKIPSASNTSSQLKIIFFFTFMKPFKMLYSTHKSTVIH